MLRKDARQIKEIRAEWESKTNSGSGKQKEFGRQQLCATFGNKNCRAEKEQSAVLFSSPTMLSSFIIVAYCHSWCAFFFCGCSIVCGFSITPVSIPCSPVTFLTSWDVFDLSHSKFLLCFYDPLLILHSCIANHLLHCFVCQLLQWHLIWQTYQWCMLSDQGLINAFLCQIVSYYLCLSIFCDSYYIACCVSYVIYE